MPFFMDLKEDVYMEQPAGFIDTSMPHHVCNLRTSLYGVKQAPRAWFDKLFQVLHTFGFVQSSLDASLFVFKGPALVIVLVYVDDILVIGLNVSYCQLFTQKLSVIFPIKDLGLLHYFLGLEVQGTFEVSFFIKQSIYLIFLRRLIRRGSKPCCTPLSSTKLDHSGPLLSNPTEYMFIVGGLQYLTWTRPDLSFAMNQIYQFMLTSRER